MNVDTRGILRAYVLLDLPALGPNRLGSKFRTRKVSLGVDYCTTMSEAMESMAKLRSAVSDNRELGNIQGRFTVDL